MSSIDILQNYSEPVQDLSASESDLLAFDWKDGLMIAVLIWVNLFGIAANAVVWLALILWSLTGTSRAVRAMILGYVLFSMNWMLFPQWGRVWVLRWFLLASASLRIFHDWNSEDWRIPRWLPYFLPFVLMAFLSSILKSYVLTISLFKLFAFALGFITVTMGVDLAAEYKWRRWIYTLWVVVLASSLPLVLLKSGYFHGNGKWFQGILNQPQMYGIFFAIPAAFLTARILLDHEERLSPLRLILLAPMWVTIILSQTRTAVFAVTLAFFVAFVISLCRRERTLVKPLVAFPILIILVISAIYFSGISEGFGRTYKAIYSFVTKGAGAAIQYGEVSFGEAVFATRTQFIVPSLDNFRKSPLIGIGFGVASDPEFFPIDTFYGVPITARTEKGFIFSALLEETGILGTLAFIVFMVAFAKNVFKYGRFSSYMLLLTAFFIVFGEMGFFSPGAAGPYIWFCMSVAAPAGSEKEYLEIKWRRHSPGVR